MRHFYYILVSFLPFQLWSQLHVSPSIYNDNYIYVTNDVLFVEKDIDLQRNKKDENLASMYLRNEAQLLQGESSIRNSGNGHLSVFQEGLANAYTYNYWSLPVENSSKKLQNLIFEPIDKIHSKPVNVTSNLNGIADPLTISNYWLYKFSGNDYSDWEYIGDYIDIEPGEGFTMKGVNGSNTHVVIDGIANNPGNKQRYDFRGKPNSGNYSLNILKEQTRLIGNPYPSALNLNKFLIENTATTGIAYFWDSKPVNSHYLQDYEGGYGTYSPGANMYVPAVFHKYDQHGYIDHSTGEQGGLYARQFSPIGQGFMVEGSQNGSLQFKNNHRVYVKENPETSQFKNQQKNNDKEYSSFRINLEFEDTYVRQLGLAFNSSATREIDHAMDAKTFDQLPTDGGFNLNDNMYVIDVRSFDENDKIPFLININSSTKLIISLSDYINFDQPVYLIDSELNLTYNLMEENPQFELSKGKYTERFWLSFLPVEDVFEFVEETKDIEDLVAIAQNNTTSILHIKPQKTLNLKTIAIYTINGKLVKYFSNLDNLDMYSYSTQGLTSGFYIVKLENENSEIITQKIIILN